MAQRLVVVDHPVLADAQIFVVDPMLATGGSAVYALARLKDAGARVFGT
jgi:uracil phosphoribosyltransferase